jgi:hypothetical protein
MAQTNSNRSAAGLVLTSTSTIDAEVLRCAVRHTLARPFPFKLPLLHFEGVLGALKGRNAMAVSNFSPVPPNEIDLPVRPNRRAAADRRCGATGGRRAIDARGDDVDIWRELVEVHADVERLKSIVRTLTDAVRALTAH